MEIQKEIVIKEVAQNELEEDFDYYRKKYSIEYAGNLGLDFMK